MVSKQQIRDLIEKIRVLPNRDDKLYVMTGKKAMSISVLDGGGVGRFEVIKMLKELIE